MSVGESDRSVPQPQAQARRQARQPVRAKRRNLETRVVYSTVDNRSLDLDLM